MNDRVIRLLLWQLWALSEGKSVLIVAKDMPTCLERGRALLRAAKALGIAVRGRTKNLRAPVIRLRVFDEPPNGRKDAYDGFIDPEVVFEKGNIREDAVRTVIG